MASKKDEKLDEVVGCLEGIMDRLEDITDGLEELNMTLQLIGFMDLADRLSEKRPDLKDKLEPLFQSWAKAVEEGGPFDDLVEGEFEEDDDEYDEDEKD